MAEAPASGDGADDRPSQSGASSRRIGGAHSVVPVFQPNKGVPIRKYPGYPRWRAALGSMPLAITIATVHGPVGIVHAEAPHHSWAESLRLFGTAAPSVADDVLLGLEASTDTIRRHRSRPVEGLRALVHGHEPVEHVECTANRWNIDTGAGIPRLNRLSLVEVNARRCARGRSPSTSPAEWISFVQSAGRRGLLASRRRFRRTTSGSILMFSVKPRARARGRSCAPRPGCIRVDWR